MVQHCIVKTLKYQAGLKRGTWLILGPEHLKSYQESRLDIKLKNYTDVLGI